MAEGQPAQWDSDELTVCTICDNNFKTPKYLPCRHTFCEKCINSYIKSHCGDGGDHGGFKCPVCRRDVPAPKRSAKPSEWAKFLPNNYVIVNIMNDKASQSKDKKCQPCFRGNETESAVSWCKECGEALCGDCVKHHRKNKYTQDHELVSLKTIKQEDMIVNLTLPYCSEHLEEHVKFYCYDHEVPGCSTCITLNHRKCEKVDTLDNAAQSHLTSGFQSELESEISRLGDTLRKFIGEREVDLEATASAKSDITEEIKEIRDKMSKKLDELEQSLLKQVTEETMKETTRLRNLIKTNKEKEGYINSLHQMIQIAKHSKSKSHTFLEYKRISVLITEFKEVQKKEPTTKLNKYSFIKNPDLEEILKMSELGIMNTEQKMVALSPCRSTSRSNLLDRKPSVVKSFRSPDGCGTQAVLFLDDSKLLLGYRYEPRCIVCDRTGKLIEKIPMPKGVSHLAYRGSDEIIVSFSSLASLRVLSRATLDQKYDIKLSDVCYGVATYGKDIVVSYRSSLCCLGQSPASKWTVQVPTIIGDDSRHIAVDNNGIIYYCNWDGNNILRFDIAGRSLPALRCEQVDSPYGLSLDCDNNIYCCGYRSGNIIQISSDGQQQRQILSKSDNINFPWCIHFKPDSNVFVVGNGNGKNIHIYDMN